MDMENTIDADGCPVPKMVKRRTIPSFLQAQFSNSLLLFSERGGFVFPEAPTGIGLAKALKRDGPLVTSISVDIGTDKISTTVKMDLYTSSFGKMQKQKEGNIAQISRERQKIIDQNNSAIRRGLGKSSSNANLFGGVLANGGSAIIDKARGVEEHFSDIEKDQAKMGIYLAASKEAYDRGVPVGGEKKTKAESTVGGIVDGVDAVAERAGINLEGSTQAHFDSFQWGEPLIGEGNAGVFKLVDGSDSPISRPRES